MSAPALAIADVYVTSELESRKPKKTDYRREQQALQELAARMADRPEELLPRFVTLAMEMAGGISAGLSFYEEHPAPGVFRWHHLTGVLSPFNGATTPRNFSPCGTTLDQNRPTLSRHPERVYDWISGANIVVPEVLLVPLYIGSHEPLGTLWIVSAEEGHFDSGHARMASELASFVSVALSMQRAKADLEKSLAEQKTLAQEMSHRVKNLFAVTEAIIRVSGRDTTTKEEMQTVLSGRLHALATAHALVRPGFSDSEPRKISALTELLQAVMGPHDGQHASRFSFVGPAMTVGEQALKGIALVVHELVTNAAKYGALKNDTGRIDVHWHLKDGSLALDWIEKGGPPLTDRPTGTGFGGKLLQSTVVRQFSGTLDQDWHPDGLAVHITLPVDRLVN